MTTVRYPLDNDAVLEFRDLNWTPAGKLFCQVVAFAPDESVLANSRSVEMSSSRGRDQVAQELANHNGAKPDFWADALLSAWHTLDQEHRDAAEKFEPVDLSEFPDPPPLREIWESHITEGLISTLYGDSGQGKSTLVDGLATCIAYGGSFLGYKVIQGPVVILDWELTRDITLHRLYRIARGFGLDAPPPIYYQCMSDPLATHLSDIIEWCHRVAPILLVVDSFGPACGNDPLNHGNAIRLMNSLRKLPTSPLVVDHQSNPIQRQSYGNKREFGTSYKRHLTRSSLQIEMANNEPGRASVILRQQKDNFGPKSDPLCFHILYEGDQIRFEVADINDPEFQDVDTLPADRRIEHYLNQTARASKKELMEQCNIDNENTFDKTMTKLRKRRTDLKTEGAGKAERLYYFYLCIVIGLLKTLTFLPYLPLYIEKVRKVKPLVWLCGLTPSQRERRLNACVREG
jgi:hypothetical protein